MSQLHKILLMIPLFIATNVGLVKSAHAFDIGVGARLGYEASLNLHWPGDDLWFGNNGLSLEWQGFLNLSNNFTAGIFADIRLASWFSISPAFNFSTARKMPMDLSVYDYLVEDVVVSMSANTFDLDLVAKFHIGWWYFGTGVGLSMTTAPTFTAISEDGKENFDPEGLIPTKGFTGFSLVLDTGLYIPIVSNNHNVFIGWRTTILLNSISYVTNLFFGDEEQERNSAFAISPVATSITVGYVYRFI